MPNLFTNIRDRGRNFVDRDNSGNASRNEWLGAGARAAVIGPVGVGVSILGGAIADTISQSGFGNRVGNFLTRQATRWGFGPEQVGPPEADSRRSSRGTAPLFSERPRRPSRQDDEKEDRTPSRNPNHGSSWAPSAGPRQPARRGGAYINPNFVSPTSNVAAARRSALVTGGYDQGGLLGMGNRAVLGSSSLNFRNPTVQNQVR